MTKNSFDTIIFATLAIIDEALTRARGDVLPLLAKGLFLGMRSHILQGQSPGIACLLRPVPS